MAKKRFPCGHQGQGQYCHRCAQEQNQTAKQEQTQIAHQEWLALFESDPVNLRRLDNKQLIDKARKIINDIHAGVSYTHYKGKRMRYNRDIISVPVNRDYRLVFHTLEGKIQVYKLMSHEEYNVKKPGEKNR
ncbi:hypothetical protein CKO12_01595 [Chromatium okenii]|uniref:DUF7682 family zinc-binding protein n=1 Tax=Chromatium okenii TaxID=61644 RepID=UPI001904DEE8|nr:hypothetical protein [Chromatium okenii]MBK1640592.1 hypothetical protein [Chromatium okenii]